MSPVTRLAWWWLRWRGWAVQLNTSDVFEERVETDGQVTRRYDLGWRPYHSIRYGKTPVYRIGPRIARSHRKRWAEQAARPAAG